MTVIFIGLVWFILGLFVALLLMSANKQNKAPGDVPLREGSNDKAPLLPKNPPADQPPPPKN